MGGDFSRISMGRSSSQTHFLSFTRSFAPGGGVSRQRPLVAPFQNGTVGVELL